MPYEAKTDWKYDDTVTERDFNRIEQGVKDSYDTSNEARDKAIEAEANSKAYTDQQIQLVTETGIPKLVTYPFVLTAEVDGQTDFIIPLETFDKETDTVMVVQNSTVLSTERFDVIDRTVRLIDGVMAETKIFIQVFKNVPIGPDGAISGSVIAVDSMPTDRIQGFDEILNTVNNAISTSEKGAPQGVATLDSAGNVPADQLGNVEGMEVHGNEWHSVPYATVAALNAYATTTALNAHANQNANSGNGVHGLRDSTISLGSGASAGSTSIAIGASASAPGEGAVAIGSRVLAGGSNSAVLGARSFARANAHYSVAIGNSDVNNAYEGLLGVRTNDTGTRNWIVPGTFSVQGTKNFEIPHPHPDKKATHVIRHGAVESPTPGDTLYRYTLTANEDGETVEYQLPDYFEHLNINVDVYVSPHMHFGRAYGYVEGDTLKVICETAGEFKVLVIGTRNDDHQSVQDWYIKGEEREIGESWIGETYAFEVDEIIEVEEIKEVIV